MANKTINQFNTKQNPDGNELILLMSNGVTMNMKLSTIKSFCASGITGTEITGGTYSNGTLVLNNSTGGTIHITGFTTGNTSSTDIYVTGGTYNSGTATFTNNTGGTFNVSGFSTGNVSTDIYVTGGTYVSGTLYLTNNTGGTFSVGGFSGGSGTDFITVIPSTFDWFNPIGISTGSTIIINTAFDLSGGIITLPSTISLAFIDEGKITNGIIYTNDTFIDGNEESIGILENITISGDSLRNEFIRPEWFGSRVSGYNWYTAIQTALDLAGVTCSEVRLANRVYQYQGNLKVTAGINLNGISRGETAFSAGPTKGTVLFCTGPTFSNNRALEVIGKMVKLSDFTIKGESRFASTIDGLVLNAVGDGVATTALLETLNINNILIHSCNRGLHLIAGNSGAITYSQFNNIRIRDCQHHLPIEVKSANPIYGNLDNNGNPYILDSAFINSNIWTGLYSSGFSLSGLTIETQVMTNQINGQDVYNPANNLIFNGVVLESPYSIGGHIKLIGGGSQVSMHDIRIEATQQDSRYPATPVVYLGELTNGSLFNMDQQSVSIVDLGYNNTFESKASKSANPTPNSDNLYKNSTLNGLIEKDLTGTGGTMSYVIPEWTIEEQYVGTGSSYSWRTLKIDSNIKIAYSQNPRQDGYKALNFIVPPKYQLRMYQNVDRDINLLTNVKVGGYVNAVNRQDVQFTYQDQKTPIISSSASFGQSIFTGNTYEPIGGWFPVRSSSDVNYYRIAMFCQNVQGENTGSSITFDFTQPQLVKGIELKDTPAKNITEVGGTVYGVMAYNLVENILPATSASTYMPVVGALQLPLEGNYFELNEDGFYIQKINYSSNRFGRGSQITLLFNYSAVTVVDSVFINLSKPFVSEVGSTLTLYSKYGDGVWTEVNRYSKKESGYLTYEMNTITGSSSSFLEIPLTGDKFFNLTNDSNSVMSISRINNSGTTRFDGDTTLLLEFNNTNSNVAIQNTTYINLAKTGTYYPNDGDWLQLFTNGNGTWTELGRKQLTQLNSTIGAKVLDINDYISGVILTLPTTGENVFTINNSGSTKTITRINDSTNRFGAGSTIIVNFSGLTNGITLTNGGYGGYINLAKTGDWAVSDGDWIELITTGNGTWTELGRKKLLNPEATIGTITLEASAITASNIATLPRTGENIFVINNQSTSAYTINRINDVLINRFNGGSLILLEFGTLTSGITIGNSAYISLSKTGSYVPVSGDWLLLYTKGGGLWTEISRKPLATLEMMQGYQSVLTQSYLSGGLLVLPQTGENYFTLNCTTSGGTIQRINNATGVRFGGGKMLTIDFVNNSVNNVTFVHSGYIDLSGSTNFIPTTASTITFLTKGDGTWKELFRR